LSTFTYVFLQSKGDALLFFYGNDGYANASQCYVTCTVRYLVHSAFHLNRNVKRAANFFLSCKANARVKLAKTGHGPHSSKLVVICVVLCIVCV